MKKLLKWVQENKLLVIILILGTFLRLYKIDQYMTFLGDEGRDAIIVRNLLIKGDPILIGPGTSVGGMYLGPLYYYFMAPFLLFSNFSPIGPAIGIALLGVITVYFVYLAGKEWFNQKVGLTAALLYAISPVVIIYSRSSWNPNIMPFFALLSVYSVWKVWKEKKYNWLIVAAVSYAFVLQSHYLGLLLGPILFLYWLLAKVPFRKTLLSLGVFLLLMSPLALFDLRHDFLNSKAVYKFFTIRQETVSIRPWTAIPKSYPIFEQINTSLISAYNVSLGKLVTLAVVLFITWALLFKRKEIFTKQFNLLLVWIATGLIGFGLYKQHVYDHYFGFLFPVPILIFSVLLDYFYKGKTRYFALLILVFIIVNNLLQAPIRFSPNKQMIRSQNVASKIIKESRGDRFNIAVIAERNYEDGYQYFLEKDKAKIIEIDPQLPDTVTQQLFVVCEVNGSTLTKEKCDPTHSSKAEVANFGWSKIESEWEVDGVVLYKLIHTK